MLILCFICVYLGPMLKLHPTRPYGPVNEVDQPVDGQDSQDMQQQDVGQNNDSLKTRNGAKQAQQHNF